MAMRVVPAASVLAVAAAALLLVVSYQASGKSELLSAPQVAYLKRSPQLYKVDPDAAGPLIYAQINSDSNGELKDYLAAAKAQRKAERDRTIGRAKQKQLENEMRMYKTCEDNPSLPGCPYTPPLQFDITGVDPEVAGPLVYAQTARESEDNLNMFKKEAKRRFMEQSYKQDVDRYEKELAGAMRLVAACNMNPSLPGCPYYPTVEPPHYPKSDEFLLDLSMNGQDALVYAAEAQTSQDRLHQDYINNKAMMDRIHAQEHAEFEARVAAGKARAEISCQMNPSLPGCPY
jgi:hypothetical protein